MINNIKKYIKQGIKIFACNSRKAPATRRGFYDATTDINILQQQFTNDDMLIGMPTGNGNNIVIIDIDVNKPMEDESGKKVLDSEGNEIIDPRSAVEILEEFESRFGKLPDTFQVETPSKGIHLYYKVPFTKLSSARRFFCKDLSVDLKANSGYVIVPDGKSDYIVYDDVDGLDIDDIRSRCAPLPDWIENFKKEVIEQKETQENILPPEEVREIRSALAFISPDPRDTWIRVGMELKSMNSPSGYGLWCEWSMGSPKYNPKDQEKRWRTLKPSGEITIASLFYEAKKAGWQSTYGKKDDLSEPEEVFKITTVYDELEKIKDFRVETYNVGPNFTELNHPKVKAIRNALTVIGAERSGGKTSFATSLATDILIHNPSFSLVLFSLDDPETISAKRLISQMLSENVLENSDFDTSSINEVLKRVVITESNVPNTEIIINKKLIKPSTQLVEICERIKKTTDTKNIIIVIDYLQIIKPSGDRTSLNELAKELKTAQKLLASHGGCIMLLLSQLNRDRDSGQSRYRETSEIENIADICIDIRCEFIETVNPQTGNKKFMPQKDNPKRYITIEKNKLFPAGQEFITAINPDFSFQPLCDKNLSAENFINAQKEKTKKPGTHVKKKKSQPWEAKI